MPQSLFLFALIIMLSVQTATADWQLFEDKAITAKLKRLGKLKPEDLLKKIRGEGIAVSILSTDRPKPSSFFWGSIEKPSGKLSSITKQKALFGKTFCKGEHPFSNKSDSIALAEDAPRSTLYHEYLHILQIRKDRSWCKISKELWKRQPTKIEQRAQLDREWDVAKVLWKNLNHLNAGIEDQITIADAVAQQAVKRKDFAPEALLFVQMENIAGFLKAKVVEYQKQITAKKSESLLPEWVPLLFELCTEQKAALDCGLALRDLLDGSKLWGDANKNYREGLKAWPGQKLMIEVTNTKSQEGEFSIIVTEKESFGSLI